MNRNKELAKNTVIITLGKVCTQFISFFLLPLYTALLTTEQYGAVDLVSTYVQLLLPIVIFQIDQAVFRYLIDKRKDRESETELISSTLAFAFLQFILFTLLFSIILILHYRFLMTDLSKFTQFLINCFVTFQIFLSDMISWDNF